MFYFFLYIQDCSINEPVDLRAKTRPGSESDIRQPWNHHCQTFLFRFRLAMTLWRPCWRSFFELIWKCCILLHVRCYMAANIVEWIVEDSGLQNKLSVVWFFNFQVLSASGKFFTSSLAFNQYCYHPATTGNSFFFIEITSFS